MAAWTVTPRTWTASEVLTAAHMNEQLRDFGQAFIWATWTTGIYQGGGNISHTDTLARYCQIQGLVVAYLNLALTGAGSSATAIYVKLPVAAYSYNGMVLGSGFVTDTGVSTYPGVARSYSVDANYAILQRADAPTASTPGIGVDPSLTLASGDVFSAAFHYERSAS